VAVKRINESAAESDVKEFEAEIDRLHHMRSHRNIIGFIGTCPQPLCILLEYINNGSLRDYLKNDQHKVPIGMVYRWSLETAAGLGHMHSGKKKPTKRIPNKFYCCHFFHFIV
jgi:serine/threonine protein kinase